MSIFKNSFHPSIKGQLSTRQAAMTNRTPYNLQYLNSRNAWIRLSSSVNVYKKDAPRSGEGGFPTPAELQNPANYDNSLANKYVLQGGILNNGKHRAGLGDFSNAYSNVNADGEPYRLGIRPMPGITGVDIKNKGAYGSLRAATVTFQCWDIKQLEDLELLYMRPGYTLLLEWGWSPYLGNGTEVNNFTDGKFTTTIDYTDIINTEWTKENLFKRQYARATDGKYYDENGTEVNIIGYQGNTDSMFGFVKNYSWKARMDGGYDCSTEIISIGEVLESLKVNYSPLDNRNDLGTNGLISPNISDSSVDSGEMDDLEKSYSQNVLAGIFYEMWEIGRQVAGGTTTADEDGHSYQVTDKKYGSTYDLFRVTINIAGGDKEASGTGTIGKSDEQIYITLETLCNLLNNYVILRDKKSSDTNGGKSRPFAPLSVLESNVTTTDKSGTGYLLSLAHPLQVSIDPTVCLIKNKLWANGIKVNLAIQPAVDPKTGTPTINFNHNLSNPDPSTFVDNIIRNTLPVDSIGDKDALAKYVKNYLQGPNGENKGKQLDENIKEVSKQYKLKLNDPNYKIQAPNLSGTFKLSFDSTSTAGGRVGGTIKDILNEPTTFYDLLEDLKGANLRNAVITDIFGGAKKEDIADTDPVKEAQDEIEKKNEELEEQAKKGAKGYKFLENLDMPYFVNDDYNTELGIIGHIYVNLNMLYNLSVSDDLASQDKKEKKEIALYDFVKSVLKKITASTGEMNNLDVFINPDNNIAQIIDINYVDRLSQKEAYENAFELQIHNLNSIVRSYSLESKIFPEQTSIVAIGAQVGGGALGVDTTTLVAFNKSIRDRIIPIKDAPTSSPQDVENPQLQLDTLTKALSSLYSYTGNLESGVIEDGSFDTTEVGKYQGAIRDLLNFFKELGKSKSKNKAILPTVLSVDMDGIGGMIIGNLFKVNSDILPKGYRTEENGLGARLGYIVTGIGHSIKENDWVTKVEAQTIILDEPQGMDIPFGELALVDSESESGTTVLNITTNASGTSAVKPKPTSEPPSLLLKAMKDYGITDPKERAHFLAQCAHESGGFAWTKEFASGEAYEGRKDLGNTQPGDGKKYKGRGYIQITGRANYTKYNQYLKSKGINDDVVSNPQLLETKFAADSACYWWKFLSRNISTLAVAGTSSNDVVKVTKRVNGGTNGLADRQQRFNGYWAKIEKNPSTYS